MSGTTATDATGNITYATFDRRGRKINATDPNRGARWFTYDVLDKLKTETDAAGLVTTFAYDLLGRPTSRTEQGLTSTWTYDTQPYGIGKRWSLARRRPGTPSSAAQPALWLDPRGQADPVTESPYSTQGWNRYSYVGNSPLNFTDPSGYCFAGCFWKGAFGAIGNFLRHNPIFGNILQIAAVLACWGNPVCGALAAAAVSTVVTGLTSGNLGMALRAGLTTLVTAAAFYGVGEATGGFEGVLDPKLGGHGQLSPWSDAHIFNTIGHAAVGCASALLGRSSCGAGALAAGAGAFMGPIFGGKGFSIGKLVATSVVGGLASAAGGGKFANGALTAAFGYLFNEAAKQYSISGGAAAFWLMFGGSGSVSVGVSVPDNWKSFGEYQLFGGAQANTMVGAGVYGGYGIGGGYSTSDGPLSVWSANPVFHVEAGAGYGVSIQGSMDFPMSKSCPVCDWEYGSPSYGFPIQPKIGIGIGAYAGAGLGGNATFATPTLSQMRAWHGGQ